MHDAAEEIGSVGGREDVVLDLLRRRGRYDVAQVWDKLRWRRVLDRLENFLHRDFVFYVNLPAVA